MNLASGDKSASRDYTLAGEISVHGRLLSRAITAYERRMIHNPRPPRIFAAVAHVEFGPDGPNTGHRHRNARSLSHNRSSSLPHPSPPTLSLTGLYSYVPTYRVPRCTSVPQIRVAPSYSRRIINLPRCSSTRLCCRAIVPLANVTVSGSNDKASYNRRTLSQ